MKARLGVAILLVVTVLGAAPTEAQYFGRNPVQWERLDFQVLKTDHFDIHYYPEEREAAVLAGRLAERSYARLSKILDFELVDRQPLILYASHPHFQQTNTIGEAPSEGTGGVTEAFKRRIVLPVGASLAETEHVLAHELVHAFQYAMTGQGRVSSTSFPGALTMPLWFIEGMAEYLSVGPVDAHTAMWMREAAARDKLPKISDLGSTRYFPYRYGQALWAYLAGRFGDRVIGESLRKLGPKSNDAETVLKQVTGVDVKTLSKDWHAAIREAASALAGKSQPADYGGVLVSRKQQGGSMNVGPALSPDGARVAFLSERDALSIELFVADTRSGRVTRRLSKTAVDPHVESLQFIRSAGAWDRAGKRFALGAVSKGRPLLVIVDAHTGKTVREVRFPGLGEIATPSFSPDGRRIVFSALVGGFSDLFIYDLEEDRLTRLTSDAPADLQPAWSPDGKSIAFATERFSTRLESLDIGELRLATIDPATLEIRRLPSFERAKNLNPQWAPSGESLYFLANPTGITNVYRLEPADGSTFQVTDLRGGVSGITDTSPALSAAAAKDHLAYSVFEEGRYEIYAVDDPLRLAGRPVTLETADHAGLIPGARAEGRVLAARADAETGLPSADGFTRAPYKARFGLDYVGQPYLEVGSFQSGVGLAGGVSMEFSDMLGEHSLSTQVQAQRVSGFGDLGAIVGYVNRQRRLNWGLQVGQVPYVSRSLMTGLAAAGPDLVYAEQVVTQRQLERSIAAVGFYPFDSSLRLEVQAGYRNIGFETRIETDLYSFPLGSFLESRRETLKGSSGLDMAFGTVALVRDTSLYGATSPILGQRFRVDVTPVFGSINYTDALFDFRQYLMPVRPVTVAARLLHYGRYGAGGADSRLAPLFLGEASLVRGYGAGSFRVAECGREPDGSCPTFDRLIGTRMLVANLEARAPIGALFGSRRLYGPVPLEIGAFFDAGVAWDGDSKPGLFGGSREWVKSVGLTARLNLLGFVVVQADYAKPLDRPGRGAMWQVNLLSGF